MLYQVELLPPQKIIITIAEEAGSTPTSSQLLAVSH
jgi:hypothetical protein